MGSTSGGVGGSSGPSGGDRGGPSGNDRDSGNDNDRGGPSGSDRDNTSRADSKNDKNEDSSQRGMTGSERTSFDNALSDAATGPDTDDDDDQASNDRTTGGITDTAGYTFGGLSNPSTVDTDRTADDAAQAAAQASHPANEFSGLGPSGGPVDNMLSGDDSRNSHRGFGPDDNLAGGIDGDVNAGLAAMNEESQRTTLANETGLADEAGKNAAVMQTGIEAARRTIDYDARVSAANTLTLGPDAKFPGSSDVVKDFTDPRTTARDVLGSKPYAPDAKSAQQLASGANRASALNAAAKTIGLGAQPAAGAIEAYMATPEDAGPLQTAINTARGAVKEADDAAVSFVAGGAVASGVVAVSPATGPMAPGVAAVGAPVAGAGAAVGMGGLYNNSLPDRAIDTVVDVAFDGLEFAAEKADDAFGYLAENIDRWERGVIDKAIRETKSR